MKILLFGKNGQVGWELQRSLASLGELVALDSASQDLCGNFTCLEGIARTVRAVAPDIIVNAAAYTAVDKAESEPALAHTINALAPGVLAREAKRNGALLIHYSTDYVFDGSGDTAWSENDPTGPLNVYGKTKLEGEEAIRTTSCQHLIFRTSWVYAARGKNFVRTILKLAQEQESLAVINDQFGAPTSASLLAEVTLKALLAVLKNSAPGGLYHVAANGETSWHGFAQAIVQGAHDRCEVSRNGLKQQSNLLSAVSSAPTFLRLAPDAIHPVMAHDFSLAAKRPANSRLDTRKLQEALGASLPQWQAGLNEVLDSLAWS